MILHGKVAVVYGGGGAVGSAVARVFAREGAHVNIAGRTATPLQRVVEEVTEAGGRADWAVADAANEKAVREHIDGLVAREGRIDILVNAVGIPHVQGPSLVELEEEQFMAPVVGYLRTLFVTSRAAVAYMNEQKSGVILTLSTPGSRLTGSGFLGNGVASAAVEGFSRILAGEVGAAGIRVVCIRPNAIRESLGVSHVAEAFAGMAERAGATTADWLAGLESQGTLLGRLPDTQDVAEYAAFAASDRARAMTGAIANLTAGSIVD